MVTSYHKNIKTQKPNLCYNNVRQLFNKKHEVIITNY